MVILPHFQPGFVLTLVYGKSTLKRQLIQVTTTICFKKTNKQKKQNKKTFDWRGISWDRDSVQCYSKQKNICSGEYTDKKNLEGNKNKNLNPLELETLHT